ncbi:hypothetical protein FSB73_04335 [Arachidicoccus ginsenosidivorans]|uniref:Uncharacterized protein n=1 Tax=Arachidicoccus ginsenosidivorans TaxID=496057 RepID=A0A5B8VL77_9BACT|nr:hypothetical protein [Arachidicoccus ginsenosidivorans]QEC71018.1 hypothetical protein FSB73_04335 [Arachidicoccus ginsenosidivorans]
MQFQKKVDYLLDSLRFFDLKCVNKGLGYLKRQGASISSILAVLLILPFLNHATVHAFLRAGSKIMANGGKDVYYRTSKRQDIDWRGVLTGFVKRFLTIIRKNAIVLGCVPKCLVVNDSLL